MEKCNACDFWKRMPCIVVGQYGECSKLVIRDGNRISNNYGDSPNKTITPEGFGCRFGKKKPEVATGRSEQALMLERVLNKQCALVFFEVSTDALAVKDCNCECWQIAACIDVAGKDIWARFIMPVEDCICKDAPKVIASRVSELLAKAIMAYAKSPREEQ